MSNNETLWQGLKVGDRQMFLDLYKKYYHCLLFIGLKEMKDAQMVKDTIQQLFLYLWEKRETIESARNIRSYLITSFLRKLSLDLKKKQRATGAQVTMGNSSMDNQPNPEERLENKDQQFHLVKLLMGKINELPNRQKELIMLKFYEGLNYGDIVRRTGLTHRTAYNKIHEALKKLKSSVVWEQYSRTAIFILIIHAVNNIVRI
ncbi:MAG: sigma-70 family RNA polymerase sigma factor [Chitinophagaceae bacterium]